MSDDRSAEHTPGLVPAFRYVRARVHTVDHEARHGPPGTTAFFMADDVTGENLHFGYYSIEPHLPEVGDVVRFRVAHDGTCELVTERGPIEHDLKCEPEPFAATMRGDKRHEVRVDDRDYRVGDTLYLREWSSDCYTGRTGRARVTYKTEGGTWGIPIGLCVMSIEVLP